jgi:hypothetical protein
MKYDGSSGSRNEDGERGMDPGAGRHRITAHFNNTVFANDEIRIDRATM